MRPVDYTKIDWQSRREVRKEYIRLQDNKCFFCKNNLYGSPPKDITSKEINWDFFPKNFLKYPIHLQHDHETGMAEGAVHSYCNAVMWQYEGR